MVLEGENAINIIQQKTAVAPVVEVRDRNDHPVAGAIVQFAIRSGRATFGGARSLSVTTNAVGRAVAAGFAPTGTGALQIAATATFQGQTAAAVTIAQTTVQTAVQAAAATSATTATASGSASAGAGTAGAAGAGAGAVSAGAAGAGAGAGAAAGGVSAATLGIVGGVATGAALAAKELGVLDGSAGDGQVYTGTLSGSEDLVFGTFCRTEILTAMLKLELKVDAGSVSGTANIKDGRITTPTVSPGCSGFLNHKDSFGLEDAVVSGTTSAIVFFKAETNNVPPNPLDPQGTTNTHEFAFTGSLNGSTITGALVHRRIVGGTVAGTTTFQVTLQ